MSGSWIKETFEKGLDEIQKLARTGSIKIDIANLKKKRDERVKLIGNKILEKIKKGEMKAEDYEPDYSYILSVDKKIEAKEAELLNKEATAQTAETTPPSAAPTPKEAQTEAPAAPTPVKEEEEKDPHEDYINRPG